MALRISVGVAGLVLLVALAGCGGKGASSGNTVAGATTGVKPSAQRACRQLTAATRLLAGRISTTLAGFQSVKSLGSLATHVRTLRAQLNAAAARIAAVHSPPGKLTSDQRRFTAALRNLSQQLVKAQRAAAAGRVSAAAKQFSSAAALVGLHTASQSLARDCPRLP